ncbi:family 2A encapsulin nanocompartment cargo protein cysteine desulfurase [Nocardia arthritidis]|nr:family 2A encapsulin nanocompartment cargo protein cysteine desulfurase [Nocardia arthritidis]
MTTHRSTGSEPDGAVPGVDGAVPGVDGVVPPAADVALPGLDGAVPSWLPDEATLNRLAGEFFSGLPGAAPQQFGTEAVPGADRFGLVPQHLSAPPGQPAQPGFDSRPPTPGLAGSAIEPEVPEGIAGTDPFGIVPQDVPEFAPRVPTPTGFDTALPALPIPAIASAPRHAQSAGFYFLTEPNPYRAAAPANSAPDFYFLDGASERRRVASTDPHPIFDVNAVRRDFPILQERINGYPLAWFDNAATTQKPQAVIDRLSYFYRHENSNIHRAAHELAARSTDAYENARAIIARFLGAASAEQIVFVRGATEGINFVAQTWGRKHIREGDEILISHLEHHANIVPWQMLAAETGALLKVIPVDDTGQLRMDEYTRLLSDKTKLVAVAHVSNALGTITPVEEIVAQAKRAGAVTLIDGAQSVPHTRIDVTGLGTDFFVFSGHKLYGPTGIGAVYGAAEVLRDLPPWQGGGNMITDVTLEHSTYQPPPARFEAGTGNIADAVGLGAAIEYVERIGIENIAAYEHFLLEYATAGLREVPGLRLIGTAEAKASVMSFVLDGYQPDQVGRALNEKGIAVRAGHHCAQPILRRFGLEATVRPSLAFYNTCAEVDRLVAALHQLSADAGNR